MTVKSKPKASVVLLAIVNIASAIGLVYTTHLVRQSTAELQALREQSYQLDAEYGRLLLEASTLGSHARVEAVAVDQLGMQIPKQEQVEVIEVQP